MRTLKKEIIIHKPLSEVFEFFSKAENLNLITPPYLNFRIITPLPVEMKTGAIINYMIKLKGIQMRWTSKITEWNPPYKFTDTQIRGPYKVWVHEHYFADQDGKTIVTDKVTYKSRGFIFEPVIEKLFVSNNLKHIFDYREKKLKEIFND